MITLRQLEIRWVDLEPTRGAETRKNRPCVMLQDDALSIGTRTMIIAPLLPGHKNWPFVVNVVPTEGNGLDKNRHINLKQIRAVDLSRITNRQGALEKRYLKPIREAINAIFGFEA